MEEEIIFFEEDIVYSIRNSISVKQWIKNTIEQEGYKLNTITYIFCSDQYLHKINVEYLAHDTYTDIITFDNTEIASEIEGDIFISIERIRENAKKYQTTFEEELHRVMIHGVLHLVGYMDKTQKEKETMRNKENYYLALFKPD